MARYEQSISIHVPMETVWSVLTNPGEWPQWFPNVDQVIAFDPSTGRVEIQCSGEDGTASIMHADKQQGIMSVNLHCGTYRASHTFDIDRSGNLFGTHDSDTKLSYMLEYASPGGFFGKPVASVDPNDVLKVTHALEQLKVLAEKRMV